MFEILFDEHTEEALARIKLTEGQFCDIVFHVNWVDLKELEKGVLSFDYDIDEGTVSDELKEDFEQTVGDVIFEIIAEYMKAVEEEE